MLIVRVMLNKEMRSSIDFLRKCVWGGGCGGCYGVCVSVAVTLSDLSVGPWVSFYLISV